jgi:hypothetical protein
MVCPCQGTQQKIKKERRNRNRSEMKQARKKEMVNVEK